MKHSKAPWKFTETRPNHQSLGFGYRIENEASPTYLASINGVKRNETCLANAKLIAAAPVLLKELQLTYLRLQVECNKNWSAAPATDFIRASLRNAICNAAGFDHEEYQNKIEAISSDIYYGNINYEEGIKKATE